MLQITDTLLEKVTRYARLNMFEWFNIPDMAVFRINL